MIKYLKQLFCRHEWVGVLNMNACFDGDCWTENPISYIECTKCGKVDE